MKDMRYLYFFLLSLPLVLACSRSEYDITENINMEMTLFEEEISVPVGSLGPLTLDDVFDKLGEMEGVGELLAQFVKIGPDGELYVEEEDNIYKINVYELEKQLEDAGKASLWNAGDLRAYPGGIASILSYLGLHPVNQTTIIMMSNPLRVEVPATSSASYTYRQAAGGDETVPIAELGSFTIPRRASNKEMAWLDISGLTTPLSSLNLENFTLELPASPTSKIASKTGNLFFSVDYYYSGGVSLGDKFSFSLDSLSSGRLDLPIGAFKLKKCEVELELESTLPLQVEIKRIRACKAGEGDEAGPVDENIQIVTGFTVQGGSMEKPAVTPIKLSIEALEGTIPDISSLAIDLELRAQPGLGPVALNARQSLFVKTSSVRLVGGITIPQK